MADENKKSIQYQIAKGFVSAAGLTRIEDMKPIDETKPAFKYITLAGPDVQFNLKDFKVEWEFTGTVEYQTTIHLGGAPNGDLRAPRRVVFTVLGKELESTFDPTAPDAVAELQAAFQRAWEAGM